MARVVVAQRAQHHCPLSAITRIQPGAFAPAALLPALDCVQGHLPPALDRLAVTNPVHAVELRGGHGGATAGKVLCRHLRKLGEVHSRHGHAHVSKPSHARHLRAGQYQNSWASINVAFGMVVLGNARAVGRSGTGACEHRLTHSHPQHACTRPRLTLNIMSGTPNSSRAGLAGVSPRSSANNIHRLRRAGGGRKHTKTTVSQLQPHGTSVSRAISRASKLAAKQSQAYRHRSSRNFWTGMRRRMLSLVLRRQKRKIEGSEPIQSPLAEICASPSGSIRRIRRARQARYGGRWRVGSGEQRRRDGGSTRRDRVRGVCRSVNASVACVCLTMCWVAIVGRSCRGWRTSRSTSSSACNLARQLR